MGKVDVMETAEIDVIENAYKVEFSKPYSFEGVEYNDVDLSGLESLSASDMIAVSKILERGGSISVIPEMTMEYCLLIAARASQKPIEFFTGLRPKDAIKIKNRVTGFFYGAD
ncbi:MAG: phage tail assembly protein [Sporomusa sp.]